MTENRTLSLRAARWTVIAVYFAGLVVYPIVGFTVKLPHSVSGSLPAAVGPILLAMGIMDYFISLIVERAMLAQVRANPSRPAAVTTAAITVAALGESLALFGLFLSLLDMRQWGLALYALCLVHGVHLAIRWPGYEQAAELGYPNH